MHFESSASLLGPTVAFDKELPFNRSADLLGVTLDLKGEGMSVVRVCYKQSRVSDMAGSLQEILSSGIIRPSEMPSLFGRLQFCEARLLGRHGRLAMADLRLLERSRENRVKIGPDQQDSFGSLLDHPKNAKPRMIFASPSCPPVLILTDGACEPCSDSFAGSIGGVLVVPTNGEPIISAFGCHLPTH